MNRKKIHVVQIIWSLTYGGAEKMVLDLVSQSASDDILYTIIIFDPEAPLRHLVPRSVNLIVLPKRSWFGFHLYKDIHNALKKLQPDLVHVHLFTAELWGTLAARSLGIPVLYTEHNTNDDFNVVRLGIKRLVLRYVKYAVACSEAVERYMRKKLHITAPISVVKNGINVERFGGVRGQSELFSCVVVGRLMPQKGHEVLLKALSNLRQYPWSLTVVGDGDLKNSLQEQARTLEITDRITWLGFQDDVAEILANQRFLIAPSLWEGLGVAVMEGMASGKVVIASDIGGLKELVSDGKTGYLVAPGSVSALVREIKFCFDNPEKCDQVALAAKEYAVEQFSVGAMVTAYEQLYKKLL